MTPEELNRLADDILRGEELPWDALVASAVTDEDRRMLAQLRTLAAITRVHKTVTDTPAPEPAVAPSEVPASDAGGPPPAPGQPVGRWAHLDLLERLGGGSYGEVYCAWDPQLERQVALKLLHQPADRIREHLDVIREARLLAKVKHPNVLTVYGARIADGRIGLWTELIQGQTLDEIVRSLGPLSAGEAALVGYSLCRALEAIHAAGILHRDIKAQNVMRAVGGRIVLMDFGAGGYLESPDAALTGTPVYLAPEVLRREPATVRSDIYSLGVLLYFLLTGTFPVTGRSVAEVREAHSRGVRTDLQQRRQDLPRRLMAAVDRASAPDPQDRYSDAAAFEQALVDVLGFTGAAPPPPDPPRFTHRTWLLATTLAALAVFAVTSTGSRESPPPTFERLTFRQGRVHAARFDQQGTGIVYSASWGSERPRTFLTGSGVREAHPVTPPDISLLALSRAGDLALMLRPRFLRGYVEAGVLARVPVAGGRPRELIDGVQGADWSPEGTEFAIVRDARSRTRLEYPVGEVLYQTSGWVSSPRVSPGGDAVAFLDHPVLNDDSGRVAVARKDGTVDMLTERWSSVQGLAWSGDGETLYFTASRTGNMRAIYAVDRRRQLRLVHQSAVKMRLHDVSPASGAALVTTSSERIQLMARTAGQAAERDLSWFDWSLVRDLSRDGRTLLMNESGEGGGERYGIYLRGTDGGDAVRLGDGSGMSLSPDEKWVLASVGRPTPRLALLPTGAGSARFLPGQGLRYQQWGAWLPDGQRVLYTASLEGEAPRVFAQEVSGKAPPIAITPEGVTLASPGAVSPDGSRIAAVNSQGRIVLYTPEGRLIGEVRGAEPGEVPVQWSLSGSALYVARRGDPQTPVHLLDLTTGARRLWREIVPADGTGVPEILRLVISRDTSAYAYSLTREFSDLYLMRSVK